MCEIKYYSDGFAVDKDYNRILPHRQEVRAGSVPRKMSVRSTLITTFGLVQSKYSGVFSNVTTLVDLFR